MRRRCLVLLVTIASVTSALSPRASATVLQAVPAAWEIAARPDALRLRITQPGLQAIPFSVLIAAGWDAATDMGQVALWYRGVEQPMQVLADKTIQFVARPARSRYYTDSVYWLTRESRPGLRAAPSLAPGLSLAWEDDTRYESRVAAPNGDHWFAAELVTDDPNRRSQRATIALPSAIPAGTRLDVSLASAYSGMHRIALAANGQALLPLDWSGVGAFQGTASLPALPAGTLTVDLQAAASGDVVLLDRLELPDAAPAFASQAAQPAVERGFGLDVTRGPAPGQAGATFLIITHPAFRSALDPLVAAHQQQGEQVAVLDVQVAYDAFSFGERDPEAIRGMLRLAVQSWSPTPRAALLVGSGSVRMRAAPGQPDPTFIPPYLVMADPDRGEIACDTCYARTQTDDALTQTVPDIPIGRFPVRTLTDAQVVVSKTVAYLTAPPSGAWQTQALFLTDNDYQADKTPDPSGSFVQTAETGVSALPIGMRAARFYYAPDRPPSGPYDSNVGRLRCNLFRAIDGGSKHDTNCPLLPAGQETGAALFVYVGHGSPWQWAYTDPSAPTSYLWYLYDADGRKNGARLPILLSMTCLSGDWANPTLMSNDERLVLWPSGGVVASLSATGQGVNTGHARLLSGLLPRLFASSGDRTLGAAHLAGLAALDGQHRDLAFSFGILGDPNVRLPFVPTHAVFLPLVAR
jgi:hypothetical protein